MTIWPREDGRWWEMAIKNQWEMPEIVRLETRSGEPTPPALDGILIDGDHPGPSFIRNYKAICSNHSLPPLVVMGKSHAPALMNIEWEPDWTRFIPKPSPIESTVAALHSLIRDKTRETQVIRPEPSETLGYLAHLHLADLLQMLCQSNWTGRMDVKHVSHDQQGQVFVRSGTLWHATSGSKAGLEACFLMLTWLRCRYVFHDDEICESGRSINIPCEQVLLEGARLIDHNRESTP